MLLIILSLYIQGVGASDFFSYAGDARTDFTFKTPLGNTIAGTRIKKDNSEFYKPCVLFIHGFVETKEYFDDLVRPHFDAGHEIFLVNLPGHGGPGERSTANPGTASFTHLVTDFCKAAIDDAYRRCGKPITLVTHSLGGMACSNYLKGVNEVNGETIVSPRLRDVANRKVRSAIYLAPPVTFHIDNSRWPGVVVARNLPIEMGNAGLINLPILFLNAMASGLDDSLKDIVDFSLRNALFEPAKGIVDLSALSQGEAVKLLTVMNGAPSELVTSMKNKADVHRKESIDWDEGKKLMWRKQEDGEWKLETVDIPDHWDRIEYINPELGKASISSYRDNHGTVVYENLVNEAPHYIRTKEIYLFGDEDRLADPDQGERTVLNSKWAHFGLVRNTDHVNVGFGERAASIVGPLTVEVAEKGVTQRVINYMIDHPDIHYNTANPQYSQYFQAPKIKTRIELLQERLIKKYPSACIKGMKILFRR